MVQWLRLLVSTAVWSLVGKLRSCMTLRMYPPKYRFEADLCKLYESRLFPVIFIAAFLELRTHRVCSRCSTSIYWTNRHILGFPGGSVVNKPLANAGDRGSIPGEEMAIYSSTLAGKISWTEEPPWGCRVRLTEYARTRTYTQIHFVYIPVKLSHRSKYQPLFFCQCP